ncbi:MAG: CRTAC1 family protein [Pirellulaceae bacterium]
MKSPSLATNTSALIGLACWAILPGCGERPIAPSPVKAVAALPQEAPWFEDVTATSGLDFVHDPGPIDGKYFMPQINGSGAALFDANNDGRLDIYLLQFGGPDSISTNALFRQLPDGKFQNVSQGSGLDINGHNHGVAVGDVNNDGWVDVLVTQYLGIKFFLNQGNGTFREATGEANLKNLDWGASSSFVDYDRDGWLDLVVVNYLDFDEGRPCFIRGGKRDFCRAGLFLGTVTRLWRNQGADSAGKWLGYEDRTDAAGLSQKPGRGMGVLCADFNGDNWPDVFVANDAEANFLWVNQKNGTFREEAVFRGLAFDDRGVAAANMGVAYGDVDGDGLSDVFITHFINEHHGLWMQQTRGTFEEQSIRAGLTQSRWHGTAWGTTLADFNQDGALDLALMNGYAHRRDAPAQSFWDDYKDRNQVFVNDGAGHFRDISTDSPALCREPNVGRGLCVGDIDGDGALDMLTTQIGGAARILRNVAPSRGHWLMIRALDPRLHRDAIGAEVRLRSGARHWHGLIQPSQSYQCANDMRAHFGLGGTERIDQIEILWPDGNTEQFACPGVDRVLEIQRGQGEPTKSGKGEGP